MKVKIAASILVLIGILISCARYYTPTVQPAGVSKLKKKQIKFVAECIKEAIQYVGSC